MRTLALLLLAFALCWACTGGDTATGPPEVLWGEHTCARCRMAVSEPEHAAVARGPHGEAVRFDDPGCLLAWRREGHGEGWRLWVADAAGGGWVPVEQAWFVRVSSRRTPMGSGWLAFADGERAAAAAGTESRPKRWSELRSGPAIPLPSPGK